MTVRERAQEWLCRELRRAKVALGRAEYRPGVTCEELDRLRGKTEAIDWLLEMLGRMPDPPGSP